MKIINFLKDFYQRKKLIRLSKPWMIRTYDLRREIALFWDTPAYMPENTNKEQYEFLVSVEGFGGSTGSGAVLDFLAEFDDCSVLGGVDPFRNPERGKQNSFNCNEFWCSNNSILSLEENIFSKKFLFSEKIPLYFSANIIKNFNSNSWIYDDYYFERSKKFLFDLIDCHWRWSSGSWGRKNKEYDVEYKPSDLVSRIVYDSPSTSQIVEVIWKKFTLDEYRLYAKEYLKDLFKHIPSKKYLIFDKMLNIGNCDTKLFSDYFGDMKVIYVWRDPRDQFVSSRNRFWNFIPKNPHVFSKRFKVIASSIMNANSNNLLVLKYEDFVLKYEIESKKIIDFLGLNQIRHSKKFQFFKPEESATRIGRYKNYCDQEAIKIIESELKEYCYDS